MQMYFKLTTIRLILVSIFFFSTGYSVIPPTSVTISGYVSNRETGEYLPEANIFLIGTDIGTTTNGDGYFVFLKIPAGLYTLEISYLGFEPIVTELELIPGKRLIYNFELQPQAIELMSIEVSGRRTKQQVDSQVSRVRLGSLQLRSLPQVGESDLMRSLQALPGVLTLSEFSSGLVIRGGNTDQNLILLDGTTVYNPFHLFGLYSNFILDAVKEVELSKGGFNAEYGGRLSAVLNIYSKTGNRKHFDARASLSLMSAQLTIEGPLNKGSYILAARRSYFDYVFKGSPYYFPYYFYDIQGHVVQDITENDRLSISWYSGRDNLIIEDSNLSSTWGNRAIGIGYRKLINSRLLSNWHMAFSQFYTNFGLEEFVSEYTDEVKVDTHFGFGGISGTANENAIEDVTFSSDWTYYLPANSLIQTGTQLKRYLFYNQTKYMRRKLFFMNQAPIELAFFVKYRKWISMRLMLEPGLRLTNYNYHSTKWFVDPRIRLKYLITENNNIDFALGYYHQFIGAVQDDYNQSIINQWFAVDNSIDPGFAIQYILGYEHYLGKSYLLQLEVYYKILENMMTFAEQRATSDEPMKSEKLVDFVDVTDGYAYGIEFYLKKEFGKLNGWCGYTYSTSIKYINGVEYLTNWDRTHVLHLIGNYYFSPKLEFNLKWSYQTGQPYTPILGYYAEKYPSSPETVFRTIPGERNIRRYPLYHRLDLGLTRHFELKSTKFDIFIQVINAYNQQNIYKYFYFFENGQNGLDDDNDGIIDESDENIPQRKAANNFPFLPSIGITIEL